MATPALVARIHRLLEILDERGLKTQGLYRVAASASEVKLLVASESEPPNLEIAVGADLLKHCMRVIQPVPRESYVRFVATHKDYTDHASRAYAVRRLVWTELSLVQRELLDALCAHLNKLAFYCAHNKMTIDNLAVCWAPLIFQPPVDLDAAAIYAGVKVVVALTRMLISEHALVFD